MMLFSGLFSLGWIDDVGFGISSFSGSTTLNSTVAVLSCHNVSSASVFELVHIFFFLNPSTFSAVDVIASCRVVYLPLVVFASGEWLRCFSADSRNCSDIWRFTRLKRRQGLPAEGRLDDRRIEILKRESRRRWSVQQSSARDMKCVMWTSFFVRMPMLGSWVLPCFVSVWESVQNVGQSGHVLRKDQEADVRLHYIAIENAPPSCTVITANFDFEIAKNHEFI